VFGSLLYDERLFSGDGLAGNVVAAKLNQQAQEPSIQSG